MAMVFLSALGVAFSGAVMPGPLLTYTIRQSFSCGQKAGFVIVIGHAILEAVLVVFIILGFDIILQSDAAQTAIGIAGGTLLMYMGLSMIRDSARNKIKIGTDSRAIDTKNMILSGFVISASNPYFLLWWAVIGLGFLLGAYKSFGYAGVIVFYIGHITADFIWYSLISVLIGKTRRFIKEELYRVIVIGLGGLLIFFGGSFFLKALGNLM